MSTLTKARPICTIGQFAKLFPSYARNIDLTAQQRLELVESSFANEQRLSLTNHWAYSLPRHQALEELRDALKIEIKEIEHANS